MNFHKGFSLIELMITVGIISILVLMGLPLYKNYVIKLDIQKMVSILDYELTRPLGYAFASGTPDGLSDTPGLVRSPDDLTDITGDCKARLQSAVLAIEEFKKKYKQPEYYDLRCPEIDHFEYGSTTVMASLYFMWPEYYPGQWILELSAVSDKGGPAAGTAPVTILTGTLASENGGIRENFQSSRNLPAGAIFCDVSMYAGEYEISNSKIPAIMPKQCRHIYTNVDAMYAEF